VVVPIQGDAKRVTEQELQNVADRVLMPLPERAYEYLDYAMLALKPAGGWKCLRRCVGYASSFRLSLGER